MEEAVYRIYRNGRPYKNSEAYQNIKAVYVKEGSAKAVITTEADYLAKKNYEEENPGKRWWSLSGVERRELISKIKLQFDVVKYVPETGGQNI